MGVVDGVLLLGAVAPATVILIEKLQWGRPVGLHLCPENAGGRGVSSPPIGIPVNDPAWTPGYIMRIQQDPSGGTAIFFAVKDTANRFRSNWVSIPPNQWVHVAMVLRRNPLNLEFYVNGTLAQTGVGSSILGDISNGFPFLIGGDGVESGELVVDEVEYFNRALTPQEIQAIFNAGSAGKCKR
ncbi:LamG domain-containing protein [Thermoflexus sp.]|uniref:LamG domain-containing protein n=1 Tax=Thermoflexus sp. TaxID=1969742 RepID=UPI0035E455FF